MFDKPLLDLPECMNALEAMLEAGRSRSTGPLAVAVVNEYGELMAFARMDGASLMTRDTAIKKAYTAARMRANLSTSVERLRSQGRSVTDYADPNFIGMARGGVVISRPTDGAVLGAVGVSGASPDQDEEIANLGLQALKLS